MDEHTGDSAAAASIADAARRASSAEESGAYEELKAAVQDAAPNERSAAAKDLVDDTPAYDTLHRALQELGIEE